MKEFLVYLFRVLREHKLKMLTVVSLMALVALIEGVTVALLVPLMSVVMTDVALTGVLGTFVNFTEQLLKNFHLAFSLSTVLVMIVIAFAIQGLLRLTMWHFQAKMLTGYESGLVHKLFSSYLESSWSFFLKSRAGELVNTLSIETSRASLAFQSCCEILSAFSIMVFYGVLSLIVSWQITLAGLALSLAASLVLHKFMARAHLYGVRTTNINSDLQAYVYDKITAAKMLKSSATEANAITSLDRIAEQRANLKYTSWMNSALVPSLYQPIVMAILALIIFISLTRLGISFAMILLFTYIFFRLTPYFSSIQLSYQQALQFIPAAEEIDRTIKSAQTMSESKGKLNIMEFKSSISFDHVTFAYEGRPPVLSDVSLKIVKGETIAIIGESGVGKSTIVDLLLGLFAPDEGKILIDGQPLSELNLTDWRKLTGYVSQDVFLFNDTVEANLKWMAPGAKQEQIEEAAKTAYAHEFIVKMPDGYRSIIGDRGVKLSGGQRQRLALARMILMNPQIILLDEATSALDSESEMKIQQSIEKISAQRTVVIISHRSTLLKNVQRVFTLESGKIREMSTNTK